MGRKAVTTTEKLKIMTLWKAKTKTRIISETTGIPMRTVERVIKQYRDLPDDQLPVRKPGSGRPRKTGKTAATAMLRTVLKSPAITAKELKKELSGFLGSVSVRTIQRRLQVDLKLPCRKAAMKPLITDKMKRKRMQFARKYIDWTKEQWGNVMFSDESTFRTLRVVARTIRRPMGSYRYSSRYTVKTMKHPAGVMVWACFTGNVGRGSIYFLPQKTMMNGDRYLNVMKEKLLHRMEMHRATHFLQDGAPCHKSKKVMDFFKENKIEVIDWPGNSPDLNPIENVWAHMKNKLKEKAITSVPTLEKEILNLWVKETPTEYLKRLTDSMPERLRLVLEHKGEMTKY